MAKSLRPPRRLPPPSPESYNQVLTDLAEEIRNAATTSHHALLEATAMKNAHAVERLRNFADRLQALAEAITLLRAPPPPLDTQNPVG